jgi:hypothetical protein
MIGLMIYKKGRREQQEDTNLLIITPGKGEEESR